MDMTQKQLLEAKHPDDVFVQTGEEIVPGYYSCVVHTDGTECLPVESFYDVGQLKAGILGPCETHRDETGNPKPVVCRVGVGRFIGNIPVLAPAVKGRDGAK